MKYLPEILWLASWPVMVWIAWRVCFRAIRKFEKRQQEG